MKKVVILGCENSHANSFLTFIKEKEEFSDVAVLGVYSDDTAAARKLSESFGVPVLADYADGVGKVDGVIITARHGDNHYKYAKPYIQSGVPMFIDKPITISEEEAVTFMRELKAHGVRVSGGSSLRHTDEVMLLKKEREEGVGGDTISGYAQAPLYIYEEYGGFYFYAQHLAEMVCEVFGRFPLSVTARKNGKQIHVIFHYENYDCVGVYSSACGHYHIARTAIDSMKNCPIPDGLGDCFYREFKEYHALLHGAEQKFTYEEFAAPVFVLNAIDRALTSGKEEPVRPFTV